MLKVTTSWDDGDAFDEKLATLLDQYEIRGTFYIAKAYRVARLTDAVIQQLSQRHEIGAHTLSHPNLPICSREEKRREILGSKQWLEQLLGKQIPLFCYPAGYQDAETEEIVRSVGFHGARTTIQGFISNAQNPFQMPTTVQVYPMPYRKMGAQSYYWRHLLDPFHERSSAFRAMGVSWWAFRSWEALAKATFEVALQRGQVFHLWGHSWEIEKYGMWEELERVLAYIAHRADCHYVTNGELL